MERPRYLNALKNVALAGILTTAGCAPKVEAQVPLATPTPVPTIEKTLAPTNSPTLGPQTESTKPTTTPDKLTPEQRFAADGALSLFTQRLMVQEFRLQTAEVKQISMGYDNKENRFILEWLYVDRNKVKKIEISRPEPVFPPSNPNITSADKANKIIWKGFVLLNYVYRYQIKDKNASYGEWSKFENGRDTYICQVLEDPTSRADGITCQEGERPSGTDNWPYSGGLGDMVWKGVWAR